MSNPTSRPTRAARLVVAGAAFAGMSVLGAGAASAHVGPDKSEVAAGSSADLFLGVPHGCEGSPTTKIEVQIPKDLVEVTPYVVPGWKGSVTTEKVDPPVKAEDGDEITERDSVVTWTAEPGQELADHWKLQFGLSFQVPDKVGETLSFPTIQTCATGSAEWIEPTPAGGEEPEHPLPTVTIVTASAGGHGAATTETTTAGGTGTTEAASGSSSSSDDGGTKGIAVAGLVAGLAGLGLGGASFAKGRKG